MSELDVGSRVELTVGPVAHGGHCVARHEGRVIFVRHALPDEVVIAEVTEGGEGSRFLRADAVQIIEASADRVAARCPVAGPGGCGGCDLQHVSLPAQRQWKATVIAEQLRRLAGIEREVIVEPLADDDGFTYRTRVDLAVDEEGVAGLRKHRSHDVLPVDGCPIAVPEISTEIARLTPKRHPDVGVISLAHTSTGETSVRERLRGWHTDGGGLLTEVVPTPNGQVRLTIAEDSFFQVHRDAPRAFVDAVLEAAQVRPGERVLDLYAGVGLFSVPLALAAGGDGQLVAVESDPAATGLLADNLADTPQAVALAGRVDDLFGVARPKPKGRRRGGGRGRTRVPARSPLMPPSADVVVLDPPRSGADRHVIGAVTALRPRRIVYVACDPAALGRDTGYLRDGGYEMGELRAFDAFPQTHHVECIATFERAAD